MARTAVTEGFLNFVDKYQGRLSMGVRKYYGDSADGVDFRVEGDTKGNLLYLGDSGISGAGSELKLDVEKAACSYCGSWQTKQTECVNCGGPT